MREDEVRNYYDKKFDAANFRRGILVACAIRGIHPIDIDRSLGLARCTTARWINGYHKPRYETVEKIAKFLKVPAGVLLGCYSLGFVKNGKCTLLKA